MKKTILLLYFAFCILHSAFPQAGEWVWIHGSNTTGNAGNFGTQGVSSPLNNPPALYELCEWTDLNGNFWMYGGLDDNSGIEVHNDLWKYNPAANEWTWMTGTNTLNDAGNFGIQGVPSPTNRPPGLGYAATSWVDLAGNLWLFGGWNSSHSYADLWKYDITSNEWTWMKGPGTFNPTGIYGTKGVPNIANYPWSRTECAAAWTDDIGNLWMFGGENGSLFNDLWRYNIATNTWTWMKGSNLQGQAGTWGTMGVEDSLNTPSGRWAYDRWKDKSGNLWLFGGNGFDITGATWPLSDLWRYNPVTNNWTWMNGNNTGSTLGVYGTKCVTSLSNKPAHRYESRTSWSDDNGNFWMFGGIYPASLFSNVLLNDVWMYCVSTNQWTWEAGDSTSSTVGNWGTIGVSSPSNKPNGRMGAAGWMDHNDHIYIFGGSSDAWGSFYNDLWKYTIDPVCGTACIHTEGINEIKQNDELTVFPNPAHSGFTVSFLSSEKQTVELRIYNTLGKQVYFSKEEITKEKFEKEINVERLSDGIYFLQLKTNEGNLNRKVIVSHP